jgi:O-antigen/teichoic acid export membrane protein
MNQPFGKGAAIRAALQMTAATYVVYAAGLLVSALIARSVGPADFGRYSYLVWLAGVLIMIGNNGLTTSAIRFVSESLGRDSIGTARDMHGWLKRRQLASLTLVVVLYLAAMPFLKPAGWAQDELWLFAAIVLVSTIAKAMYLFSISVAKGYGRFDVEAVTSIVVSVLNAAAVVVLIMLHAPLMAYLVLFALTCIAYAGSAVVMLRIADIAPTHGAIEPVLQSRLKQHLLWTVVLTIAVVFSNKSVETWLLNEMVGPAEVGYFAIAAALTRGGVDLLSSGLTTVLMPSMAHAFGAGGQERVNSILSRSVRYFLFLGLLLAGVGALWADVAVDLMYGPRYEPVINVLRIMMVVGGLTLSDGAFGALLSTTDNQRLRAGFSFISIVFGALAAVLLIPRYGLMGAIMAYAISHLLVFAITLAGIVRIMSLHLPWRELGRLLFAALIATLVALAMMTVLPSLWTSFAAGVVYAIVYVGGTVLLHAWKGNDAEQLLTLMQRMPRLFDRLQRRVERWATQLPRD